MVRPHMSQGYRPPQPKPEPRPKTPAEELLFRFYDDPDFDDTRDIIRMDMSATTSTRRPPTGRARPNSALNPTTRSVNDSANEIWEKIEQMEIEKYRLAKEREAEQQRAGLDDSTTQDPESSDRVQPKTGLKPVSWAAMMQVKPSLQMGQLDSEERRLKKEKADVTWSRLWKLRGVAAPTVYNAKRMGESPMQKIEELRRDPVQRRELATRIDAEEEEKKRQMIAERGNMQKRNIETVNKYASYFAQAKRATAAMRLNQALKNAEHKRQGLQSWRTARTVDALQRPAFVAAQRRHALEVELLVNSWATFVFAAVGICELHDRMVEKMHQQRMANIRRYIFAGAVLRENLNARQTIRLVRAAKVAWRFWILHRPLVRLRRKNRAADLVKRFISDIGESIRIPIAVKKKLRYVRLLQRCYRFSRDCITYRTNLCVHQLDHALKTLFKDDEMEVNKLKSAHRQYERDIGAKRGLHRLAKSEMITEHRQTTDRQVIFLVRRQQTISALPLDLKRELVREFVLKKRHDYSQQVYRYGIALKHYYREQQRTREEELEQSRIEETLNLREPSVQFEEIKARKKKLKAMKPIKPYQSTLFTKEEVTKLVNTAMDRLLVQAKEDEELRKQIAEAEAKHAATKEGVAASQQ